MKASDIWQALAWCVLILAMGMAVYRAKTQTIAHDEALEYEWFLSGGVYHVLEYNPANHILFTLLAKPIVWSLGVGELTLRAPSLLGTAIYLLTAYLLCRRLFGAGVMMVLSIAMLCLNPQILDFMPAARGYILGLAGLVVAMYAMARLMERGEFNPDDPEWRWGSTIASVALAMSVLGSFTNVVPVVSLVAVFSIVAMGSFRAFLQLGSRRLRQFARYFLAPGAVAGFCFLWPYALQVRMAPNKTHFDHAASAARDLFTASFLYKWTEDLYNGPVRIPPAAEGWQARMTTLGAFGLLPLLFLFTVVGFMLAKRKEESARTGQTAQCRVFAGAAIGSVLLILFLHFFVHLDYPYSRYCLFLIPLFTVGGILAGRQIAEQFPRAHLRPVGLLILAIVVMDYGLSLQTTQFRYHAYDVISLKLYQAIADDAHRRGLTNVRVGGTWWYEPEINFYRRKFNATWMKEYDIKDKSYFWETPNDLKPADYDYFVFMPAGDPGLTGPHVKTIFQDRAREVTIVTNER